MAVPVIEIDFGNTISQVVTLTKSIEDLKKARKELQEQIQSGTGSEEKNREELVKTEQALRAQTKELRTLNSVIDNSVKQRNSETGSIAANRAELSRLTAEYIKLGKPTKEQTDRIKELSDTLKKQESAIGNTSRNVGNYKEALTDAVGGIKIFGTSLGSLWKTFLANPIVLVIAAFGALIASLLKLKPIADFVEAAFASLSATFSVVIGSVGKFITGLANGKGVVDSFSDSFTGLASNIADAAKETFELTRATQALTDAQRAQSVQDAKTEAQVKNLIIQSKDRTKTEQERLAILDEASKIEKENFDNQLKLAKERERIAQIEFDRAVKNGDQSDAVEQKLADAQINRINLESQSADLQEKITVRRNQLLDDEANIREKNNAKAIADSEKLAEQQRKADEENAKRLKELQESLLTDFELQNQKLDERVEAYRKAGASEIEIEKFRQKELAKIQDEVTDNAIKELERQNKNEISLIQDSFNKQVIAAEGNAEKIKEIEAERNKALLQQTQDFLREQFDTIQTELQTLTASTGEGGLADILLSEEKKQELQDRLLEIEASLSGVGVQLATIETNEETGKPRNLQTLLGLDEDGFEQFQAGVESATGILQIASDAVTAQTNNRLAQIEDEKIAAIKAAESRGEDTADIEKKFAAQEDKIRKEQAKKAKAIAIVNAIIQTALAVMQALSGSPPPASYILAAVAAGLGAAQIGIISSQKLAKGGEVKVMDDGGKMITAKGDSHSAPSGGIDLALDGKNVAKVEDDEKIFVMKKTASQRIGQLSKFNEMFGGNSWFRNPVVHAAQGGSIDGGFSQREFARNVNDRLATSELIDGIVSNLPTPEVKVSEINRVQRSQQQTVSVSELG